MVLLLFLAAAALVLSDLAVAVPLVVSLALSLAPRTALLSLFLSLLSSVLAAAVGVEVLVVLLLLELVVDFVLEPVAALLLGLVGVVVPEPVLGGVTRSGVAIAGAYSTDRLCCADSTRVGMGQVRAGSDADGG